VATAKETAMDGSETPTTYEFTTKGGRTRTIRALRNEELGPYHEIGRGVGVSLGHAFFEGIRHCDGFTDRVAGFVVSDDWVGETLSEATGKGYVAVTFYELVG
jgi:hypothetical protein